MLNFYQNFNRGSQRHPNRSRQNQPPQNGHQWTRVHDSTHYRHMGRKGRSIYVNVILLRRPVEAYVTSCNFVNTNTSEKKIIAGTISKYNGLGLFSGFGHVKIFYCSMQIKDSQKGFQMKTRPVPFAFREKLKTELDNLEKEGIIYKIKSSPYVSSIVCVKKKDGNLRVCGDFRNLNSLISILLYLLKNCVLHSKKESDILPKLTFTKLITS